MSAFEFQASLYAAASFTLVALLWVMGISRNRTFAHRYGAGKTVDDLSGEEALDWENYHEAKFNSGPWRWVLSAYILFHFPGFLFCALLRFKALYMLPMLGVSAVVWLTVIYFKTTAAR